MDDEFSIVQDDRIKDFSRIGTIFTTSFFGGDTYYRPLVSFSYMLEYRLFKLNPFFYYLTNLILHLGCAVVLFFVFDVLLKKKALSLAAALFFTVHPLQWEAVSNIAGRSILLCAFWYFLSFLFYLKHLARGKGVALVFSWAAFLLSLLSKEAAVTLPLTVLSYEYFIVSRGKKRRFFSKEMLWRIVPFWGWLAGYFLLRQGLGITKVAFWPSLKFQALGMLTFLRGALTYLRLLVMPWDLHFDRSVAYFTGDDGPQLAAVMIIFAASVWAVLRFHQRWSRRAKFFLAWVGVSFLPVAQIFPLLAFAGYAALADHFLYIPLVGAAGLGVLLVQDVARRIRRRKICSRGVLRLAAGGFFIYLILLTAAQGLVSSQDLAMSEQSLKYNPRNTRVRISYGLALAKVGLFKEAEEEFRRVLAAEPWDARARIALAKSLCDQEKCVEAVFEYEAVADAGSMRDLLEKNLRYTYEAVIRQYLHRLAAEPDNSRLHYSLGVIYAKSGRMTQAIARYKKAVELDPQYRYALFNLGSALEASQQEEEAVVHFKKIVSMDSPSDSLTELAYQHLGHLYHKLGKKGKADFYFQKAAQIPAPVPAGD